MYISIETKNYLKFFYSCNLDQTPSNLEIAPIERSFYATKFLVVL